LLGGIWTRLGFQHLKRPDVRAPLVGLPRRVGGALRALRSAGATAPAGFVDTRAAAISIASVAASGHIEALCPADPRGMTTNLVTKVVLALSGRQREFAWRVIPGLVLVAAAARLGAPWAKLGSCDDLSVTSLLTTTPASH